eukprot:TRINITY_DN2388_c0_g4_i1.p1 TRINITY_DN2388_c0_g4~~TRINITY_DN2388_c0_g4_i1.p1  ORF type:complete len:271 (+),score=49.20 TRINITY_DN2388_c0_g4_i1:49-813(+)
MWGYGMRSNGCFVCGQTGHMAKNCTEKGRCHNCQEEGHKAVECPHPQRCRRCGKEGHKEFECTIMVGAGPCHNCGKTGHYVRDCPIESLCHNCQKPGHKVSECTEESACRRCKKVGHKAFECDQKRDAICPFYSAGSCKKGQECDYEHIGAPRHHMTGYYSNVNELRRDTDGKRYSKAQFKQQYGGYAEWDGAEERMSFRNGKWYNKSQFKEHFGDYYEWDRAMPASGGKGYKGKGYYNTAPMGGYRGGRGAGY